MQAISPPGLQKTLDDGTILILPYTKFNGNRKQFNPWEYTYHRYLAAVTRWVRLKSAAMDLKKLAIWSWKGSFSRLVFAIFAPFCGTASVPV